MTTWYCAQCDSDFHNRDEYLSHVHPAEINTIDEIQVLFEDLALEIYFGLNFKHSLLKSSDATISLLRQLVDKAKADRLG